MICHWLHDGDVNDDRLAPYCLHLYARHALDENTGYAGNLGGERQWEGVEVLRKHIGVEDNGQLEDRGGIVEGSR